MKTIYIRQKRSGNFEFSNRENHTVKFTTLKALRNWYINDRMFGRIIKATYSKSQIYFSSYKELEKFIKNR